MGCIESGGERERATAGNLENSDERTWSWFRMFWLRMLQGVKDRTVEASALSEADEWACCSARIAKKLRVLTILENNRCEMPGRVAMNVCGEMKLDELKILVVRQHGEKGERNVDYLGTYEWDKNEMPSDESIGYTKTREDNKIGAMRLLLELNKLSNGVCLTIKKVTVSTIIMCEKKDQDPVHWHNTFVPHGNFTTSWGVTSYMTRLMCHFNTQENALLSGLERITLQTSVVVIPDNTRVSRSADWERKVGAACEKFFGSISGAGSVNTTEHMTECLFDQMSLLNLGQGPPEFLMGVRCGLGPDVGIDETRKSSIQLNLGGAAYGVCLEANTRRLLLHREKSDFIMEVLVPESVSHVPSVSCASGTRTNRDLSSCPEVESRTGRMPVLYKRAACFAWKNTKGETQHTSVFLF